MKRVAASLAAVLLALASPACGEDGAEPGAPKGATLVLDFQPNAVHAGIYAARARGHFEDEGIDLDIREPSSAADGAKLLESGRVDFAVMDISDLGIARERGLDLVAIAAIVQRPLASVIARDRDEIRTPADLHGKTIGVTGVPSDDAVLDTVLRSAGVDPGDVRRVTVGFNAVAQLAAGQIDAATAFWNAEGVQLKDLGIPTREFRVDEFGAPRYPELLLVARAAGPAQRIAEPIKAALNEGYEVLAGSPDDALGYLIEQVPGLDRAATAAQLDALESSGAFALGDASATAELDRRAIREWRAWAGRSG